MSDKQLPEPMTDDLEMRACAKEVHVTEDIVIEFFEVYIIIFSPIRS